MECLHEHVVYEHCITMCTSCGFELDIDQNTFLYEPTRCYIRKNKDPTIYPDIKHLNISNHVKDIANEIYVQTCKDKLKRATNRKGIIFAAVFHAYKLLENPQSCDMLISLFNIKRKDALKGIKYIHEFAPQNSPIRSVYITPEHLIHEFMSKFQSTSEQRTQIVDIYRKIKDKSTIISRSRPQSVAAGVIYYYIISQEYNNIDIKDFVKKVNLSELTIQKIAKECQRILS